MLVRLVEGYLHQPYIWFLNRNSAELGKSILSQVSIVIDIMRSLMSLISKHNRNSSNCPINHCQSKAFNDCWSYTFFGLWNNFYFTRKYLNSLGKENLKNDELRFIAVSEAFGQQRDKGWWIRACIYKKLF